VNGGAAETCAPRCPHMLVQHARAALPAALTQAARRLQTAVKVSGRRGSGRGLRNVVRSTCGAHAAAGKECPCSLPETSRPAALRYAAAVTISLPATMILGWLMRCAVGPLTLCDLERRKDIQLTQRGSTVLMTA
jgi:hypothetical protein